MALNTAVLIGRLTADPELRTTTTGIAVTRFTIAVDRAFTKQGEERKADFINIVAWRNTAEFITRYFSKGSMIAIQGSIQTGSYEKDGVKHYTFDVVADSVSFCGSKNDNNNGAKESQSNINTQADFSVNLDYEDLPF